MSLQKIRRKSNISYKSQIIEAVVEKTGATRGQVEVVFNFLFFFIKEEIKDPEEHSFRLPYLGVLYFKVEYARTKIKALIKSATESQIPVSEVNKSIQKQIELFDAYYENLVKGKNEYSVHKTKKIISRKMYRKGMSMEEFENSLNA